MGKAVFNPVANGKTDLPHCGSGGVNVGKLGADDRESDWDWVGSAQDEGGSSGSDRGMGNCHHRMKNFSVDNIL